MKSDSVISNPSLKQLVLVGGGHSQLQVLMSLAMRPIPGLRVVLISKDTMTGYSGMLPGYIAGHYSFEATHIDLRRLCAFAGATFLADSVVRLDTEKQEVICAEHGSIHYDWLSINIGSTPDRAGILGMTERLIPVKPITTFLRELDRIEKKAVATDRPLRFGVIGAGAAGVEVLLSVKFRLEQQRNALSSRQAADFPIEFHLFSTTETILPTHNEKVQEFFKHRLAAENVVVHTDFRVTSIEERDVVSRTGERVALDEVMLTTSASAQEWPAAAGLKVDARGFIEVNEYLQSCSHPNIFAAGDIANFTPQPAEKAGVFAVRHGGPLAVNLRRSIEKKALKPYRPQRKWLAILACGDRYAVASKGAFFAHGRWVWRWKDHIDRKFMRMFQQLPEMPPPALPRFARGLVDDNRELLQNLGMRCAGCGAKVGGDILQTVLDELRQSLGSQALEGLDQRDDAAVIEVPSGQLLVQSLDYFTAIVDDPWQLGRIAANHALGDIYAMGAQPHSALTLASIPPGSDTLVAETLRMMLQGAVSVFEEAGACIVGGHTSEASDLSLGFSVNGFADGARLMHKSGMQPGDRLLMTQPLGTGVLFAGHQQLKTKGSWLEQAIEQMTQSPRIAADILHDHGATACTDITGFGLLGHLLEMLKPDHCRVALVLASIPLLEGALALSQAGIRSSLFPDNANVRHIIENLEEVHQRPSFELLFDPQTAGGLLATVPAANAQKCLDELRKHYPHAALIGTVLATDEPQPGVVVEA
jgi:selenide,water dikinase